MQETQSPEPVPSLHQPVPAALEAEQTINVVVIYENAATCQWARERCEQMFRPVSRRNVHTTWWNLNELGEPAVLAGAVSKAMRANVIVVAIRATEGFPLPFYVWAGTWLPHRMLDSGTLVALIASPQTPGLRRNRAADYFRALAARARMDCQITERNLLIQAPANSGEETPEGPPATVPALDKPLTPLHRYASRRWRMAA